MLSIHTYKRKKRYRFAQIKDIVMAKTAIMKVWDVELGLAVHIKAPNGKYIVIDLGSKNTVSPISYLHGENVGYMVITHPHHDHFSDVENIGSARPTVLRRCHDYSRQELLADASEMQKQTFEAYCNFVESYTETVSALDSPASGTPFDGLSATAFSTSLCDKGNKNNFSSIVVLKLGNAKVVVCGDNETESFDKLMKLDEFKDAVKEAYVLVAPHHGRDSGYYEDFVSLVNPYLTIISDTSKGKTSVTEKYANHTKGWKVFNCSTLKNEDRQCLTTRNDGNIQVEFGETDDTGYSGYLHVETHV